MADRKSHSGGPGTNTRGGVVSTIENASGAKTSMGSNGMGAPFEKPHSTGGGGIPVTMYDKSMKAGKVPAPSQKGPGYTGGQSRPK